LLHAHLLHAHLLNPAVLCACRQGALCLLQAHLLLIQLLGQPHPLCRNSGRSNLYWLLASWRHATVNACLAEQDVHDVYDWLVMVCRAEQAKAGETAARQSAEQRAAQAESATAEAKNTQEQAQSAAAQAQAAQGQAESAQLQAESQRATAESDKSVAQLARTQAEAIASAAQAAQARAESERSTALAAQAAAEMAQQQAECARAQAERQRCEETEARRKDGGKAQMDRLNLLAAAAEAQRAHAGPSNRADQVHLLL